MAGNTFGQLFTVASFGESHGPALGCVVDGCPPGLELAEEDIQRDVERRRSGTSRLRMRGRTTLCARSRSMMSIARSSRRRPR